jgi:hypothetical protein
MIQKLKNFRSIGTIPGLVISSFCNDGCIGKPGEKAESSNLLFLITYQQRFDAISYHGNTVLETPKTDSLATEGASNLKHVFVSGKVIEKFSRTNNNSKL